MNEENMQCNTIQYNTMQYFIDTPLVDLFSENVTNNVNIPIKN